MTRLPDNPQVTGSRISPAEIAALARFRAGDSDAAFQDLLKPHLGAMRGFAQRLVGDAHWADDLVQETLLRAFAGLATFRGDASLRTWVFRILSRLSKEPGRWRRGERAMPLDVDVPDTLGPRVDDGVLDRELRARLDESLERLSQRERAAIHLRAVEGMDYRAIGGVLECSETAARMRVLAARRKVMERMEGYLDL